MPDTLSRIAGPANIGSGTTTVFTGATGHTYTIKSILIVNDSTGSISIKLGIGGVADSNLILPQVTLGAGEQADFDGLLVMSGAETLQAVAGATGLTITVSGLDQS
jgi:hypothetical protein